MKAKKNKMFEKYLVWNSDVENLVEFKEAEERIAQLIEDGASEDSVYLYKAFEINFTITEKINCKALP